MEEEEKIKKISEHYSHIFKRQNIKKEIFEESFHYYQKRPKLFEEMYEKIMEEITKLEVNTAHDQDF